MEDLNGEEIEQFFIKKRCKRQMKQILNLKKYSQKM